MHVGGTIAPCRQPIVHTNLDPFAPLPEAESAERKEHHRKCQQTNANQLVDQPKRKYHINIAVCKYWLITAMPIKHRAA